MVQHGDFQTDDDPSDGLSARKILLVHFVAMVVLIARVLTRVFVEDVDGAVVEYIEAE